MMTRSRVRTGTNLSPYAFIAFPLAIIYIFTAIPALAGMILSLFQWTGGSAGSQGPRFIGLDNYTALVRGAPFWYALRNTLVFSIITVPVTNMLAFLLASAIQARWFRGKTLARTLLFLPTVISIVAIGFLWRWVLDSDGLLKMFLVDLGLRADQIPDFLGNSVLGLSTIMLVSIWRNLGFAVVLYLAALASVPHSAYDAASVDGATGWQSLWHVTWPGVSHMTWFLNITGFIGAIQVFDIVYVMIGTTQQPWTDVLNLYLYREFTHSRIGFAAAIGAVILIITIVVTLAQLLISALSTRETHQVRMTLPQRAA